LKKLQPAFFIARSGFGPSRQVEAQPKSASGGLSVSEIPLLFKRGSNPAGRTSNNWGVLFLGSTPLFICIFIIIFL
jgi:hypothetical protein